MIHYYPEELFEVTICDLKNGGANGKEGTGADNGYYSCNQGAMPGDDTTLIGLGCRLKNSRELRLIIASGGVFLFIQIFKYGNADDQNISDYA